MSARVRLVVDLGVLRDNYRKLASVVAPCGVIGVLKANAYGLGVKPIAAALRDGGVGYLAVAELKEALDLGEFGLPVLILGSVLPEEIDGAVAAGIVLPIGDRTVAGMISRAAARQGRRACCHFVVDTGMGRLGMLVDEAEETIKECVRLPGLDCEGIYSHFSVAYRSGGEYTKCQIEAFKGLLERLAGGGVSFRLRHIANSDAINNFPETYRSPFNAVRTGINLHGSFDMEGQRAFDLKSVLSLRTRLTAVRRLRAGMSIGYGCTYKLPRDTLVGTASAGYADGLPLALSNRGYLLVRGCCCPVLGRVSMDYTTIDLSQVPGAEVGDEAICLGGDGPERISVDDWARLKGTHAYEVICSFGTRVERVYVNGR